MSQLTKEQIEAAVKHARMMWGNGDRDWNQIMAAAAPYLQLPWEPPTDGEIEIAITGTGRLGYTLKESLERFVSMRNAALLPNVDDRRAVVIEALKAIKNASPDAVPPESNHR